MEELLLEYKSRGVSFVIFGDIFLEDLRIYRETNLAKVGLKALFPLWKKDTTVLINTFLEKKFRTITCCVNDAFLGKEDVGVEIDQHFISGLPEIVDPCGENGEYHSFCFAGPIFSKPITFKRGEKIYKPLEIKTTDVCDSVSETKGFWFCDLDLSIPE